MIARTHLAFGLLAALLIHPSIGGNFWIFAIIVLIGSLLPDIDHPGSTLGSRIKPVSTFISATFGHRGFFHSLYIPIALAIGVWFFGWSSWIMPLAIGYTSHLLGDAVTKQGLNLLHPLSTLRVQGFFETGSATEHVLCLVFMISSVYLFFF